MVTVVVTELVAGTDFVCAYKGEGHVKTAMLRAMAAQKYAQTLMTGVSVTLPRFSFLVPFGASSQLDMLDSCLRQTRCGVAGRYFEGTV